MYSSDLDVQQQPAYQGSGQDVTGIRPQASRMMDKRDYQFNEGIHEANEKEREQTKQDEEKLMDVQGRREA